ncbi:MAG: aspartate racemase [Desulfobacteraceae bacterium IS3]|nr:MAG: aspartate racemase [Desulfobacteraceae bacterium IS3]
MKKIGIIGGIGPESTLDYYKRIISAFQSQDADYPEIIIYSANLTELMQILNANAWGRLTEWLLDKIESLHRAGAEFAVIGSNTPHIVFDELISKSPLPMLSITEETCRKAQFLGLKKLGLLGTKFTMSSDFFKKPFHNKGMSVVVPEEEDQTLIHHRLFSEIELGIIKDSTREELLAIVRRMIAKYGIDSVILGCTELPLILDKDEYEGILFLNTTAIHAESIVRYCVEKV